MKTMVKKNKIRQVLPQILLLILLVTEGGDGRTNMNDILRVLRIHYILTNLETERDLSCI